MSAGPTPPFSGSGSSGSSPTSDNSAAPTSDSTYATTPAKPSGGDKSSSSFTPSKGRKMREFDTSNLSSDARRNARYAEQSFTTEGTNIGPVDPDLLKDELLPLYSVKSGDVASVALALLRKGVSAKKEWEKVPKQSGGEVEVFNALNTLFQRLDIQDTHNMQLIDYTTGETFRPDGTVFSRKFLNHELLRQIGFGYPELIVDVKPLSQDPVGQITDPSGEKSDGTLRRRARGQFDTYAEVSLLNGFRTGIFSLAFMLPNIGRAMWHDRSGTLFTDTFDFRTSGEVEKLVTTLEGVLDVDRGVDTSVVMIDQKSSEAALALDILLKQDLPDGVQAKDILPLRRQSRADKSMIFDERAGDLAMMLILNESERRLHRIVVHRSFSCDTSGLTGPGTRHFRGIDLDEKIIVHVQEDWRSTQPGMESEVEVYQALKLLGVPHLPDYSFGSDVPVETPKLHEKYGTGPIPEEALRALVYHDTRSYKFVEKYPGTSRFRSDYCQQPSGGIEVIPRRLCRMVFNSILLPLSEYRSTRELAQALRDAADCHDKAFTRRRLLHRNIGGHSIFIDARTKRGMLMIWNQSVICTTITQQRSKYRIGCWQFMSVDMLEDSTRRPHELRDDLESFVHVLFYYVMRYRPTLPDKEDARREILSSIPEVFEHVQESNIAGVYTGGKWKRHYLGFKPNKSEHFSTQNILALDIPLALQRLITQVRKLFQPLHERKPQGNIADDDSDHEGELARWEVAHDQAKTRVSTSAALLAAFDANLPSSPEAASPDWPSSDRAIDQYPRQSRPSAAPFQGSSTQSAPPGDGKGKKRLHPYSPGSGRVGGSSSGKRPRV
ncbi:hypothetical protein PENSPDRAFT_731474 [Peniophora sp. CONT]|nr:hypothetical protein PENSPDRAFT_731474 [Peniophora sp. CONT]